MQHGNRGRRRGGTYAQNHTTTTVNLQKAVKIAGLFFCEVRKAAVLSLFRDFVLKLETCARESDQAGVYKLLKMVNLEGKRHRSSAYVEDKDDIFQRDVELNHEQWVRWFHTLLSA